MPAEPSHMELCRNSCGGDLRFPKTPPKCEPFSILPTIQAVEGTKYASGHSPPGVACCGCDKIREHIQQTGQTKQTSLCQKYIALTRLSSHGMGTIKPTRWFTQWANGRYVRLTLHFCFYPRNSTGAALVPVRGPT